MININNVLTLFWTFIRQLTREILIKCQIQCESMLSNTYTKMVVVVRILYQFVSMYGQPWNCSPVIYKIYKAIIVMSWTCVQRIENVYRHGIT